MSPVPAVRRTRLLAAAVILAVALPGPAFGAAGSGGVKTSKSSWVTSKPSYVSTTGAVAGVTFTPLINSGESAFGTMFEGIPDGVGVVPPADPLGFVDLYVAHEQSRVPFSGFGDFVDSSVTRVRVDLATKKIIAMDVPLGPEAGFIRFCSAFMAGPDEGFPHYTFLLNEESNDPLDLVDDAVYDSDPFYAGGERQAGYTVWLDTADGKYGVVASAGRHNHENQVIVPGGWDGIWSVSGDDTFNAPSSQLYLFGSRDWQAYQKDEGALWAFRVTATDDGAVNPLDAFNDANDYREISLADAPWQGEFIPVPEDVARGTGTGSSPQDQLEAWSNANNVFQFIRVEDIAYDPDDPRTIYFADTGTNRLEENPATGRLRRLGSGGATENGRIFKMILNADDPLVVDAFSVYADGNAGAAAGMRNPDNLEVGHDSIMVQEDPPSGAKIWQHSFTAGTWTHIATATQSIAETSGVLDVSEWFGAGWWAVTVQSHVNLPGSVAGSTYTHPVTGAVTTYTARREDGQLLLMYVPGS